MTIDVHLVEAEVRVLSTKPGDVVLVKVAADSFLPPPMGDTETNVLAVFARVLQSALPDGVACRVVAMDGDLAVSVIESP